MQTTIRRFLTLFLCWFVMVGAMLSPLTAYASDPTQDGRNNNNHHIIKDNGDGSYSIIQTNKKAQSPNVGVTVGYQITAGGKTITIPRDTSYKGSADIKTIGPQESKASNGYTYVTYETRVSGETAKQILAMLNSNGEVRMDHVMAVSSDGGNTVSSVWNPETGKFEINAKCKNLSWFAQIMKSSGGDGAYDMNEMEAFMKGTFAWMDPKSWETNWMKLLKLAENGDIEALADALKELEEEKEDKEDKTTTLPSTKEWIHRASTPITQVYTYNDSRNYEDEQGKHAGFADDRDGTGNGIIIPSKEKYINGLTADTYAGTAAIAMGEASHDFSYNYVSYNYTQLEAYQKEVEEKNTATGQPTGRTELVWDTRELNSWSNISVHGSYPEWGVTGNAIRKAQFIYIYDLELYDFKDAETSNGMENSQENYSGTDKHVRNDIAPDLNGPVNGGIESYDVRDGDSVRPAYSLTLLGSGSWNGSYNKQPGEPYAFPSTNADAHITWGSWTTTEMQDLGDFSGFSEPPSGEADEAADALIDSWVKDGRNESENLNTLYYATYSTDTLIMGYDSRTVVGDMMPDRDVKYLGAGEDMNQNFDNEHLPSYLKDLAEKLKGTMNSAFGSVDTETYETTPAFGKSQKEIVASQANGEYYAEVNSANYEHVLAYNPNEKYWGLSVPTGNQIKGAYAGNDPIIVDTPVVSVIAVYDDPDTGAHPDSGAQHWNKDSGDTTHEVQLKGSTAADGRNSSLVQLRLDNTYWFKFSPREHLATQGYYFWEEGSGEYKTPDLFDNTYSESDEIKFDKYVSKKLVHFPFAVCVYEKGNDTPTYYPATEDESDPKYWITIYDADDSSSTRDNLLWTKFYIPSWSLEGSYADESGIRFKVEACNVITEAQKEAMAEEWNEADGDRYMADTSTYVAKYDIGVQLSGWIYDFEVVGSNNRDLYDKQLTSTFENSWHDLTYPFAYNYEEKKAGNKNRLGNDPEGRYTSLAKNVRYTRTGEIAHTGDTVSNSTLTRNLSSAIGWDKKNTIIIDNTKSHKYEDAGTAPKGTEFAFSVKTMSNLWNDGDWVEIKPTFWWWPDSAADGAGATGRYVLDPKSGTSNETHGQLHVYYNDYSGSNETLYIEYGSDKDKALVTTTSLSDAKFNGSYFDSDLRKTVAKPKYDPTTASFYNRESANIENLVNNFKNQKVASSTLSNINLTSELRVFSGNEAYLKENLNKDYVNATSVDELYILEGSEDAVHTSVNPSMQTWYGTYTIPSELFLTTMTKDELTAYANEHGGIAKDDKNVWLQGGYLVVHFDITSHNSLDSKKDLTYEGAYDGNQSMWEAQGYGEDQLHAKVGSKVAGGDGHYANKNIRVDWGDVFIINMSESVDEWFEANYWTTQ